ncbi:putative glutamate-5-semialdehyde dehydrogenase, Glutamate 5-kinase [Dioscorea sansibarensis]
MEEPIGHVLKRTQMALGVLLIIFESRPDAWVLVKFGSVPSVPMQFHVFNDSL